MTLSFNEAEEADINRAAELEAQAWALRKAAYDSRDARERDRPAIERLIFAAHKRCACGLGMAYDPQGLLGQPNNSPFQAPFNGQWECSGVLLGTGDRSVVHTSPLPFAFYEILAENQPSAQGATTR